MNYFKSVLFLLLLISSCKTDEKQKNNPLVSKKANVDFVIAFGTLNYYKPQNQYYLNVLNDLNFVKFGQTQQPKLWDYADGIDTFRFLLNI